MDGEKILTCRLLGRTTYQEGLDLQRMLQARRSEELIGDTLLFLEHQPVYTMGRRAQDSDFLVPVKELEARGYEISISNRGGQITYHGPGQLVVYFIIHLYHAHRELRSLINNMEKALCEYLSDAWDLDAHVEEAYPGVWVGQEKIAALGLSVNNKVTMHGIALNLDVDLGEFEKIVPCGIRDRGVCSVKSLTGMEPDLEECASSLAGHFARSLGYGNYRWE